VLRHQTENADIFTTISFYLRTRSLRVTRVSRLLESQFRNVLERPVEKTTSSLKAKVM
jgi:hypothetical protein